MKNSVARKIFSLVIIAGMVVSLSVWFIPARATVGYCSGGSVTSDGGYIIHTYTYTGIFTCPGGLDIAILIVAGGGGGGYNLAGGGGGGDYIYTNISINAGSYTATVGNGGTGATSASEKGQNGYNSSFGTLTAFGGGGGGSSGNVDGAMGGSGGGGAAGSPEGNGGYGNGTTVNSGGVGAGTGVYYVGGGGGGAAENGHDATSGVGGAGGDGLSSAISGASVYYAGGGGGGAYSGHTAGEGGNGGGGNGGVQNVGSDAPVNRGGGGGGGGGSNNGGKGGSGIVIIRYLSDYLTATPIATSSGTVSPTLTPSYSPTPTSTPVVATSTPTSTPDPNIIWAASSISITNDLKNAIAAVLIASPPPDISGNIYGILAVDNDGTGGFYISLAALPDLSSPYITWDVMDDSQWMGSVQCTGAEPTWACDYFIPATHLGGENATGLIFPWSSGTWAQYGSAGIHHDGAGGFLPGDDAVDFFGDDGWSGSMPPYVYAVESGTVISHCDGAHNGGIVVSGSNGKFMYFHLLPGQSKMATGTVLGQGEMIGTLAHGSFDDSPCGHASQNASAYHIHFAFIPSGGFFSIGGCSLDLSLGNWLCGSDVIHPLEDIPNGGNPGPGPTVTPGGPTVTPGPAPSGGETTHIWDGLLATLDYLINIIPKKFFPTYLAKGFSDWFENLYNIIADYAWFVAASQLIYVIPSLIMYSLILTFEVIRMVYIAYKFLRNLII